MHATNARACVALREARSIWRCGYTKKLLLLDVCTSKHCCCRLWWWCKWNCTEQATTTDQSVSVHRGSSLLVVGCHHWMEKAYPSIYISYYTLSLPLLRLSFMCSAASGSALLMVGLIDYLINRPSPIVFFMYPCSQRRWWWDAPPPQLVAGSDRLSRLLRAKSREIDGCWIGRLSSQVQPRLLFIVRSLPQ